MSPGLRRDMAAALDQLQADGSVTAVVLAGDDHIFPRQVHITEIDTGFAKPHPADLADRIERFPKPVVAMLEGTVVALGAELALAAHWRVAAQNTSFGLPNVALGLPPIAGASQRLPRLVGARHALVLLMTGQRYPIGSDVVSGLADEVVEPGKVLEASLAAAERLAGGHWRRTADRTDGFADPQAYQQEIASRRAGVRLHGRPAEAAILDAVEAALLLPIEAGLELERTFFDEVAATERARGMRHAFRSESRAVNIPEGRPVALVGLLRAGTGAVRLSADLVAHGISVLMAEPDAASRARYQAAVAANLEARLQRGAMKAPAVKRALELVMTTARDADLAPVEILFDTAPDDPETKRAVLSAIAGIVRPATAIASLTRHLDVAALAPDGVRDRVVGLHLPTRPYPARLAEVVLTDATGREAASRVGTALRQIGRMPIRTRPNDGLIGNAVTGALMDAADMLVLQGLSPLAIDAAVRGKGFARGPYHMLADMDIEAHIARGERRGIDNRLSIVMARAGLRLGFGSDPDSEAAALESLVSEVRGGRAVAAPGWTAEDIWTACLAAMVNEGARLIGAGVAGRPLVVDVVMLQGYGFPRHLGGPMKAADMMGLFRMLRSMRACSVISPALWAPDPMIEDLQRNSRTFDSLNG